MNRASMKLALAAALGFVTLAVAPAAMALDPRTESAARASLKRAAEKYLATDFASASAILTKASRVCGVARCSAATKAAVLRDLGTMQFRTGDEAAARESFTAALALQPDLSLAPEYDAPDVRAVFDAVRGAAGTTPEPTDGDFTHTPAGEQKVNTPLAVYAEISSSQVARAVVKYRGAAMSAWARVDMKRVGKGWGALIPCGAVTAGTMRYWIQGFDASGLPTASSGDPEHPFTVPIRTETASEASRLPGEAAPVSCDDGAAPGAGETGATDATEPALQPARPDGQGALRRAGEPADFARWWIGVAGSLDLVVFPGGSDLCAAAGLASTTGYYCTNPGGSDFPASAAQAGTLVAGQAGYAAGGLQPGDARALLAVDYALNPSILIGGRLGYVLNAYPTGGAAVVEHRAFGTKIHLEARGTYVFGDDPLTQVGFAPTAFVSLGMAEFDAHTTTIVSMNDKASPLPIRQPVNVWVTNGPWFVGVGGGARYQFSARAAFNAALRVDLAFGGVGALVAFGPEIAFQYGFGD